MVNQYLDKSTLTFRAETPDDTCWFCNRLRKDDIHKMTRGNPPRYYVGWIFKSEDGQQITIQLEGFKDVIFQVSPGLEEGIRMRDYISERMTPETRNRWRLESMEFLGWRIFIPAEWINPE